MRFCCQGETKAKIAINQINDDRVGNHQQNNSRTRVDL